MKNKLPAGGIVSLLVYAAITQAALGQVRYNAADDFSPTKNPNGVWSYGWVPATNLDFMLYTNTVTSGGFESWIVPFLDQYGHALPCVVFNANDTPVLDGHGNGFQAHRLVAAPGVSNERSVVRWTSLASGPLKITSAFEGRFLNGSTADASVYHNGNLLFIGAVNGYDAASRIHFATNLIIAAGDTLDFMVDYGSNGNYIGDNIEVDATNIFGAYTATATATLTNGFVTGAAVTDSGDGYTNTPLVRLIGGGGSGAQAVAVVSNGVVTAVTVLNPGSGYTSAPVVVIEPPFILNSVLSIAPMSFLAFSNLTLGGVYQLQQSVAWYWSNQPVSFTATNALFTQMVAGAVSSGDYRLALNPVPAQAFATAAVSYGFVVGATLTSGGSGYVTSPAVTIVGGGGTNATAVAQISGGVVTNITITSTGTGYTSTPTVEIAQPPAAAVSPTTVLPMMRLDSASLAPYHNYQIQLKPGLGGAWANWNGELFSPTDVTNSQYLFITNGVGFFRLQYVP